MTLTQAATAFRTAVDAETAADWALVEARKVTREAENALSAALGYKVRCRSEQLFRALEKAESMQKEAA